MRAIISKLNKTKFTIHADHIFKYIQHHNGTLTFVRDTDKMQEEK